MNTCTLSRVGRTLVAVLLVVGTVRSAELGSSPTLTLAGAKALVTTAVRQAEMLSAPGGAIAVVDAGGSIIYMERLDGTFPNASPVSIGKARTAALFGKPTRVFEDTVNKGRYSMLAVPEVAAFTPLMGGVPIEIDGKIIGAIGISGAASAAQDDEIASAAVAAFVATHSKPKSE